MTPYDSDRVFVVLFFCCIIFSEPFGVIKYFFLFVGEVEFIKILNKSNSSNEKQS